MVQNDFAPSTRRQKIRLLSFLAVQNHFAP